MTTTSCCLARPVAAAAAVFLACRQVVIAAMMLPPALPALALADAPSRGERRLPVGVCRAFLAGYARMWTAFALPDLAGDAAIHWAVDAWPCLAAHADLIGGTTLACAGAFQLTPLKGRCLAACHDPRVLSARYYRAGAGPARRPSARHGGASVGCCWGFVLIMLGIGVGGADRR